MIINHTSIYSRQNVCEWDYFNRVKDVAGIIHIDQWKEWRMKGIAFEFGDAVYNIPNPTMLTIARAISQKGRDRGMVKDLKGYWVDIVNGPFISHGVEIDDTTNPFADELFEVVNKGTGMEQMRHHTVEIAMYNLISFMWELEVGAVDQYLRICASMEADTSQLTFNSLDRKTL